MKPLNNVRATRAQDADRLPSLKTGFVERIGNDINGLRARCLNVSQRDTDFTGPGELTKRFKLRQRVIPFFSDRGVHSATRNGEPDRKPSIETPSGLLATRQRVQHILKGSFE